MTKTEKLKYDLSTFERMSKRLKGEHVHGDWKGWRALVHLDMIINDIKIAILEEENKSLKESLEAYEGY